MNTQFHSFICMPAEIEDTIFMCIQKWKKMNVNKSNYSRKSKQMVKYNSVDPHSNQQIY